jgi:hypothetical protein
MIDKTNDPALRAYVEKEIKRRRMEAARGSYKPIYTTPEKQFWGETGAAAKVPKVKSAERPGRAAGKNLIHEDLKRIEKELHNIAQELRFMNKNGRRK